MEHILSNRIFATRRGTILVGFAAAGLAGLLLLVYLSSYRSSVVAGGEPVRVLVAERLIPQGTAGGLIGSQGMFVTTEIRRSQAKEGALTDPAALEGRVAAADIYPGQQLTTADFGATISHALPTKITGVERAISVPVGGANGMVGHVREGDRVDVYAGFNVQQRGGSKPYVKLLLPNVLVLSAPAEGGQNANVVLRVGAKDAARVAFASDNGKLWLIMRPQSGAKPAEGAAAAVSTEQLLGVPPVQAGG
jgi:pilus assembly protein CpaB